MSCNGRPWLTIPVVFVLLVAISQPGSFAQIQGQGTGSAVAVRPDKNPDAQPSQLSVARQWDEQLLGAIRIDIPKPPVHARNLFHLSVAMWDAWAAYSPTAVGYLVKEKHNAADVEAARDEAISFAAYRLLKYRFPVGYLDGSGSPRHPHDAT